MLEKNKISKRGSKLKQKAHPFEQYIDGDTLNLSRLNLTDSDIKDILQFLCDHPYILRLDLSFNHIGDQGLWDFIERNCTVVQLDFCGNNISDVGLAIFAYKNQIIVRVNFSHNRLSDEAIVKFAEKNQNCYMSQFSTMRYH